jgi:hypothetical protein
MPGCAVQTLRVGDFKFASVHAFEIGFEIVMCVVFFLPVDIVDNLVQVFCAKRENTKALLPAEWLKRVGETQVDFVG